MTDILFISPSSRDIYQSLKDDFSAREPNIWAGLLANAAKLKGYEAAIYDMNIVNPTPDQFYNDLKSYNCKLVIFVCTGANPNASSSSMVGAVKAADLIKSFELGYTIGFVGPHPGSLPHVTLERHPSIDFVLINEGVYSILDLLANGKLDKTIKGVWWRNGSQIEVNNPSEIVKQENLEQDVGSPAFDLMPPASEYRTSDWHTNYLGGKSPFLSTYTSLGCIYKCNFCMINSINRNSNDQSLAADSFNTFRYWKPEFTIKQFEYFAENGISNIKIADEMYVLKIDHFLELCKKIKDLKFKFNIWCYSRFSTLKERYLDIMREAGITWVGLGVESANQTIRQEITKGVFKDEDIRSIVKMTLDHGINPGLNYIFGLGHDDYTTMNETFALSQELNSPMANFYAASALPGSPLYLESLQKGYQVPEDYAEFGFLAYETVCSPTPNLTSAQVLAYRDWAFDAYYKSPRFLDMIKNKFGDVAVDNINKMTSIKLKRRLLGD